MSESFAEFENTAWVIITEFCQETNRKFDPDSEFDCAEILRRINRAAGKHHRTNLKGLSLDQPLFFGEEERTATLLDSIRATDHSDPLEALQIENEETERFAELAERGAASYSQHSAYIMLLLKFEDIDDAANHLAITTSTLKRRIQLADEHARKQPSLFDRVVSIGADFVTPRRFALPKLLQSTAKVIQASLEFINNYLTGQRAVTR